MIELQSQQGIREIGDIKAGTGNIVQPELVPCTLMKMIGSDGKPNGRLGAARSGGRFVCALPKGYDHNVGIMPYDGKLMITHPNMPALIADPETGKVRRVA